MNVYDQAHNLEQAIRESEEYKQMMAARKKIDAEPGLKKIVDDFHQKQMELQMKQMAGDAGGQDLMAAAQELYQAAAMDPTVAEFLQCEMRFGLMMQDVGQILGDLLMPGGLPKTMN